MHLTSVRLQNYRGFEDVTLSLDRPLTVIVGVNGAGKTSLLEAISCLAGVGMSGLTEKAQWNLVEADIRQGAPSCELQATLAPGENGTPISISVSKTHGALGSSGSVTYPPPTIPPKERPLCVAFCYPASRNVPDRRYSSDPLFSQPASVSLDQIEDTARFTVRTDISFEGFFSWFRYREDLENEQRLNGEPSYQDRSLRAVRTAIESVVPEISRLRVKRSPLQLVARKKGVEFRLDQLSGGERGLLAMVGDLAYRLALAYPELPDPLGGEALVLIDEIEQHLHPAWQRIVAGQLQKAFPGCRFVLTTHSPQVLSEVPGDAVLLLNDFQVYHPAAPTEGRDTNAILEEVFDVASRPDRVVRELEHIGEMLDEGQPSAARERLDQLAESLTERDPGVARLRALLDVTERIDAGHPQGE